MNREELHRQHCLPQIGGDGGYINHETSRKWRASISNQKASWKKTRFNQPIASSAIFVKMNFILSLLALSSTAAAAIFDWDCTNSLGPCNNACFRVNCLGTPLPFTYDSNLANRRPRRTASGCNRTPCTNTRYGRFGNSCDEFPFASVREGGAGATLRCVDSTENSSKVPTSFENGSKS